MRLLIAIAPTVACIIYSQLMTKWRVVHLAESLAGNKTLIGRLGVYLTDPLILSAYAVAFAASILWVFVVERYALSNAFPVYIGMVIVFVSLGGVLLFDEVLNIQKAFAIVLIIAGVYLVTRA